MKNKILNKKEDIESEKDCTESDDAGSEFESTKKILVITYRTEIT